jgi:predicted negative regulator of RcsB-dependent stress response
MLKGLIACGAVIAVLLAGLGWQTWQLTQANQALGQLNTTARVCQEATEANRAVLEDLEHELAECIGQATVIESERAADRARRAHQVDTLGRRVESLQAALRASTADDECAGRTVPDGGVERLRDAADRAQRAGDENSPPMGAGAG